MPLTLSQQSPQHDDPQQKPKPGQAGHEPPQPSSI
jgi:hypothetical protein